MEMEGWRRMGECRVVEKEEVIRGRSVVDEGYRVGLVYPYSPNLETEDHENSYEGL